jgi:protein-S-isoprenylcysteine O-methyltransferase Ste14
MWTMIIFGIFSIIIISVSWRTLWNIKSHGFYRFFSWECIAWLFSVNYPFWFHDPFQIKQILSWIFLIISIYLVIAGVNQMKRFGIANQRKREKELFQFESTTKLVTTGIFKLIRHPLYSSLIFITWGIFLKNTTLSLLIVSVFSTFFLFLTSKIDEKECIRFFGEDYRVYMKKTKMFLPFLV